jgi:hypothetical protein
MSGQSSFLNSILDDGLESDAMSILYAYAQQPASRAAGKAGDPIRFVASTEDVARDGMIIEAAGWDLAHYRANPVFLWGHDMLGSRPPIGKAGVAVEGKRLMADVTFDQDDAFARDIERKYRDGFLNAVSVSWDTREYAPRKEVGEPLRVTKAELLAISAVPVPSDVGALMQRGAARRGGLPIVPLAAMPADYQRAVRTLAEVTVARWRDEERRWRELSVLLDLDGVPRR